jgi:hypothetical protein
MASGTTDFFMGNIYHGDRQVTRWLEVNLD